MHTKHLPLIFQHNSWIIATIIYRKINSKLTLQKNKNKAFSLSKINFFICLQTHSPSEVKTNHCSGPWPANTLSLFPQWAQEAFPPSLSNPQGSTPPAWSSTALRTSLAKPMAWLLFSGCSFFHPELLMSLLSLSVLITGATVSLCSSDSSPLLTVNFSSVLSVWSPTFALTWLITSSLPSLQLAGLVVPDNISKYVCTSQGKDKDNSFFTINSYF